MKKLDFDLFVIGAGSGGVRAANLAVASGCSVGIAEEYRFGGTCVIRGCVPKKLMVYAADFRGHFNDAASFGWDCDNFRFSWNKFLLAKNHEIDRLEFLYRENLQKNGVKVFPYRAKLLHKNKVCLSDGTVIGAKTILIATGGKPFVPKFPGSNFALTSDDVFNLSELPKRLLIIGGGYIASEFSGIFHGLGSQVTQVYRGEKLLRGFDLDIRKNLSEAMINRGIDLRLNEQISRIDKFNGAFKVALASGSTIFADVILSATGRHPNTFDVGLEETGVKCDKFGAIIVDQFQRSSLDTVFAVGDVTNRLNLTPVAIRDSIAFVQTAIHGVPTSPDHQVVPTAVFTRPEIGTVGLSDNGDLDEERVEVFSTMFRPMAHTISGSSEKTMMKLIVSKQDKKVLGCHIFGPDAAEMIQLAAVAIKMGATKDDFDRTCAVHPTAAEELVTLK